MRLPWGTSGVRGSVSFSTLQGGAVELLLADASFLTSNTFGDHGQKGSFTIHANMKNLTAKQVAAGAPNVGQ
ncbi:MAG: hypothetical protein SGI86_17000 [Deltaproteobacteria bacterium]|nr:hypothetical protein [Deltaproteobacteria bacterium]